MQWWCAARGVAWTWSWQAYPGVWLFVAAIGLAYWRWAGPGTTRGQRAWFVAGLVTLWAALDWPLGPLGAGHLASVHVVQFLLIGILAPALMLLGLPHRHMRAHTVGPRLHAILRDLTHPVVTFGLFNGVMVVTHWPSVSDALMSSQPGAFLVDVAWLAAGLAFWWPIIVAVPRRARFGPLLQGIYLGLNGLLLHPPAAIMLFSEHPVYATYELAPPFPGVNTLDDQQLAGGIMKAGTTWLMFLGITGVIVAWHRRREDSNAPSDLPGATEIIGRAPPAPAE